MKKILLLSTIFLVAIAVNVFAQPKLNDNDAICMVQKAEANMKAGQKYDVSVSFKNMGKKTWEKGDYWIVYTDPRMNARNNNSWGIDNIKIKKNVKPGRTYKFKFTVTAPSEPGIYFFSWIMCNSEGTFGLGSEMQQISVSN